MIGDLGAPELLIIFAIVILLFGAGKVSRLGKDLGTSVREFRSAVRDDTHDEPILLLSSGTATPAPDESSMAQSVPQAGDLGQRPPALF